MPHDGANPEDRDAGAAAVEFAIVSLLLFTLLFMIFGAAWALWEFQAARATAREAARLASVGIPDVTAFERGVLCIGERNGVPRGATNELKITFYENPMRIPNTPLSTTPATVGSYVDIQLTYTAAARGLPFVSGLFAENGRFTTSSVARVEQLVQGSDIALGQTITSTGKTCS
jgi:hypothetical protein